MRDLYYENQGSITYLVYEVIPEESIDSLSLGMLTNNKIPGLAQTVFTQMDTSKYIKFNVSAKVSAAQFFTGAVNRKRLLGVFTGIVEAMLAAEDYMLPAENILLDMNYIFADVSTCETVLVCLPIDRAGESRVDLGMFFKNIMFSTQFDQTENCDYVARIINYLNGTPVVSLEDFKKLLDELKGNAPAASVATTPVQPTPQVVAQPVTPVAPVAPVAPKPQAGPVPNVPTPGKQPQAVPVPNVPPMPAPTTKGVAQSTAEGTEKGMSLFYLMQHYNKDNAATYKAQQEAKKNAKAGAASKAGQPSGAPLPPPFPGQMPGQAPNVPPMSAKPAKAGKADKKNPAPNFAIPGQGTPTPGFAVPGQSAPAPQPMASAIPIPTPASTPNIPPMPKPVAPVPVPTPTPQPAYTPMSQQMNFGETTVLGGGGAIGETTVLSAIPAVQKNNPYLICQKNGEKIPLNKPVFRIGKERSYVDYFIGDNTAISRSHANIVARDGEYFVMDTNSTNHTYLNGAMLQSNVEVKIAHGDKIRLANEDFEFFMY